MKYRNFHTLVKGANGISAQVIADSICNGKRITTLSLKYGLIVHAEFLRHRLISNSVKSNRAIPMKVLRKEVLNDPYVPVWFGKAQKGMIADGQVDNPSMARRVWLLARYPAVFFHWVAEKMGAHKEWANRILNPWQFVRETVTATEWANFYALRLHRDAQEDIQELAKVMSRVMDKSSPQALQEGEWHVPYVLTHRGEDGVFRYFDNDGEEMTAEQAVMASTARVARSSYDKHDKSGANLQEDVFLYRHLIESKPTHGSPAESVATPMIGVYEDEYTHISKDGKKWSGNLVGWVQHRQQIEGNAVWDTEGDNV